MAEKTASFVEEIVKDSIAAAKADVAKYKTNAVADAKANKLAPEDRRKVSKALVEKFVWAHLEKHKDELLDAVCEQAAASIGWEV
jgi:hypothetical protein